MKRILAVILTSIMLLSSFTVAQATQTSPTTTPPVTVTNPTDPLTDLINNETNAAIKGKLQEIADNRQKIRRLRETFASKVQALSILITNMPEDDDNEALDKARDIVEDFVDQLEADAEHDQKFLRQIQKLQNIGVQTRQKMAESSENAANGEKRRTRMRRGWQGDDDNERKNSKENNNMRQTRRIERNEQAILKRIDRIIRSQQRIIERLERRISRIDNLIAELRS